MGMNFDPDAFVGLAPPVPPPKPVYRRGLFLLPEEQERLAALHATEESRRPRKKYIPLKKKRGKKMAKEVRVANIDDVDLIRSITADPIAVLQKELARALSAEITINRHLYAETNIDSRAISDSNKRMMDLADALKALPRQHDTNQTLSQKSSAELLADALQKQPSQKYDSKLEKKMLARANDGFGDE